MKFAEWHEPSEQPTTRWVTRKNYDDLYVAYTNLEEDLYRLHEKSEAIIERLPSNA